jgi:hypothetical protein
MPGKKADKSGILLVQSVPECKRSIVSHGGAYFFFFVPRYYFPGNAGVGAKAPTPGMMGKKFAIEYICPFNCRAGSVRII